MTEENKLLFLKAKAGFKISDIRKYSNLMGAAFWQSAGEKVELNKETGFYEAISKNAKTGKLDYEAPRTIHYSEIEIDEQGVECVLSYSNDENYKNWKAYWRKLGFPLCYEEYERDLT